jgi:hypothetical protein
MRILIGLAAAILGISIWSAIHRNQDDRGRVLETWETANSLFRIRVTAYADTSQFLAGGRYVFQSAPVGSDDWQEIMTLRFDDPVPIPREQVRFVDDHIGYAFMGAAYAVTIDSGHTWTLWNADVELKDRVDVHSRSIEKVDVAADGTGVMKLYANPFQKGPAPILRTQDHGRHWSLE